MQKTPITLILNHDATSVDPLDELARISLGILKENGWQVDRIQPQQLLLTAVPYYTRDEEKIVAARIEAMTAAHKHRIAQDYGSFSRLCAVAACPLALYAFAGFLLHDPLEGTYSLVLALLIGILSFTAGQKAVQTNPRQVSDESEAN